MIEVYGYSIATVPAIVTIIYGIIEFLKHFAFDGDEKFKKHIPVLSAIIGGAIGIICFFTCPEIIPVANWFGALLAGCASGLSAVGVNQIAKQIKKNGGDKGGS
jgi:hypothetical protein